MKKGKKLYEGKAKIIYATNDKNLVIQYFKDDATAFNNQKKTIIEGKGVLNNRISEHILSNLSQIGIKNHLVKRLNMREQIIKLVEIIPIEFIVRNVASGSITKRLGIEDGTVLKEPLIEYCLKDDKLGDPLIAEEHILAKICSSAIKGSPSLSSFKQYSISGSFKTVPSSIPNLLVMDPDATFLTINSIGIISTNLIICSRILSLFTKWFLIPICDKFERMCSEILLFKTPFPSIIVFFWLLNAVASSLKYWITKFLSFVA